MYIIFAFKLLLINFKLKNPSQLDGSMVEHNGIGIELLIKKVSGCLLNHQLFDKAIGAKLIAADLVE
jgi:hypothetical protein